MARAGRKPINPTFRFRDVIPIWEAAQQRSMSGIANGELLLEFIESDEGHAIQRIHRLNTCRATMRDLTDNGYHKWDDFVVRKDGNKVQIWLKAEFDWSRLTDGQGNPINRAEVENFKLKQLQDKAKYSDPDQKINARRFNKNPVEGGHPFDHTKPLDLESE